MKITIKLDDPYDGGLTEVVRDVTWPEEPRDDVDLRGASGEVIATHDPMAAHLADVTTKIAKLAVDIHTTR